MHRHRALDDALGATLDELLGACRVLCFDEFHVHDIANAMLLDRLFSKLFAGGVTLVATSNVVPDGLQRVLRLLAALGPLEAGANRYELHFVELADFSKVERSGRDAAIREAVQRYADSLADLCHKAPYNWFNFFDFWQKK